MSDTGNELPRPIEEMVSNESGYIKEIAQRVKVLKDSASFRANQAARWLGVSIPTLALGGISFNDALSRSSSDEKFPLMMLGGALVVGGGFITGIAADYWGKSRQDQSEATVLTGALANNLIKATEQVKSPTQSTPSK